MTDDVSTGGKIISIHALLAESDLNGPTPLASRTISIHALLAESDVHYDNYNLHCIISIHALLAESDWIDGLRA